MPSVIDICESRGRIVLVNDITELRGLSGGSLRTVDSVIRTHRFDGETRLRVVDPCNVDPRKPYAPRPPLHVASDITTLDLYLGRNPSIIYRLRDPLLVVEVRARYGSSGEPVDFTLRCENQDDAIEKYYAQIAAQDAEIRGSLGIRPTTWICAEDLPTLTTKVDVDRLVVPHRERTRPRERLTTRYVLL